MNSIRFTCTSLVGTNKKGILPPDKDGYRYMPVGALNVVNSAGQRYVASGGARELFESGPFKRRVKRGALRSEVGHPIRQPGMSDDDYIQRIMTIVEANVCAHIAEIELDFNTFKNEGDGLIAIMAKIAPSGPHAAMLERSFSNPNENVCFSIRAFTSDYTQRGVVHRILRNVITFDYVNEPGIHIAEKFKSPSLESFSEDVFTEQQIKRAIDKPNGKMALESLSLSPMELYTSLGWCTESLPPIYKQW